MSSHEAIETLYAARKALAAVKVAQKYVDVEPWVKALDNMLRKKQMELRK